MWRIFAIIGFLFGLGAFGNLLDETRRSAVAVGLLLGIICITLFLISLCIVAGKIEKMLRVMLNRLPNPDIITRRNPDIGGKERSA